jgi:hypothetical protein
MNDQPKLLVSLTGLSYGGLVSLDLVESLKERFQIQILTLSEEVATHCRAMGFEVHFLPAIAYFRLPKGQRFRHFRAFQFLEKTYNQYRKHRYMAQQSKRLLNETQPHAMLLNDDMPDHWEYFLAAAGLVRSVIVQTTFAVINPEAMSSYIDQFDSPAQKRLKRRYELLSRLTGRSWILDRSTHPRLLYGGQFSLGLGAFLAGTKHHIRLFGGHFADFVCLQGPAYGDLWVKTGVSSHKIVITGSPIQDEIYKFSQALTPVLLATKRQEYNIPAGKKVILVVLTRYVPKHLSHPLYAQDIYDMTERLLRIDPNIFVVLKTHPKRDANLYTEPVEKLLTPDRGLIFASERYPEQEHNNWLIALSDVSIQSGSTVGLNILALKKPMLSYHRLPDPAADETGRMLSGHPDYFIRDFDQMETRVSALLSSEAERERCLQAQKKVADDLIIVDGKAHQRIGDILEYGRLS